MKTKQEYESAIDADFPDMLKRELVGVVDRCYTATTESIATMGLRREFGLRLTPQLRHYMIQDRICSELQRMSGINVRIENHSEGVWSRSYARVGVSGKARPE